MGVDVACLPEGVSPFFISQMGHSLLSINRQNWEINVFYYVFVICVVVLIPFSPSPSRSPLSFDFIESVCGFHRLIYIIVTKSVIFQCVSMEFQDDFHMECFCLAAFMLHSHWRSGNLCVCARAFIWAENEIYFERFLFNLIFSHILLSLIWPRWCWMFAASYIRQRIKWSISSDFIDLHPNYLLSAKFAP